MMNKEKYYVAFFDAEFTAKTAKDRGIPEMIQCAFLIYEVCSQDNKYILSEDAIATYTTFVKPVYTKKLSEYIKELTGIAQKTVDEGKAFKETINDMHKLIKEYDVQSIITWGPDHGMLKKNFWFLGYDRKKAKEILNLFDDISLRMSKRYGYETPISQSNMCQILNVDEYGEHHNAYDDTVNLVKIIKEICDNES